MPRRAFPADTRIERVEKSAAIAAPVETPEAPSVEEHLEIVAKIYMPLTKAVSDKRIVTGVVLMPETVDAHGDIYDAEVIAKAAHDFLANYNVKSEVALMHKDFKRDFDLLESYLAPIEFALGDTTVKAGTWLITVRVNEDKIWDKVKKGEITGFSIGGKAKVKQLKD